jgi:DegV family protein with EDD domain
VARVRIVTDSTADVPKPLADELGITVVPCYVHFGQEAFLDGVDLSREQFHARLVSRGRLPTTSPPPVGAFADVYRQLAEQTDQIISIHPAPNLSSLYNAARVASEMIAGARIALIDSTQATMGSGWLAVLAARAAQLGQSLDEIVTMLRATVPRLRLVAVIDDLQFLHRSGRVRWVEALVGSVLSIKPIVMLKDGQVTLLEKARTRKNALERLVALTAGLGSLQEVAALHANAAQDAEQAARMLATMCGHAQIPIVEAGTTMTSHAGPRALAFSCVLAEH